MTTNGTAYVYKPHRTASWLGTVTNRVMPTFERHVPNIIAGVTMGVGTMSRLFVKDGSLWIKFGWVERLIPDSHVYARRLQKTGVSSIVLEHDLDHYQVRLILNTLTEKSLETAARKLEPLGVSLIFTQSAPTIQ